MTGTLVLDSEGLSKAVLRDRTVMARLHATDYSARVTQAKGSLNEAETLLRQILYLDAMHKGLQAEMMVQSAGLPGRATAVSKWCSRSQ